MAKMVTISNKNTNKFHKVVVAIYDTYCIWWEYTQFIL